MQDSDWFDMEVVHSWGTGSQWNRPKYCWSGIFKDSEDDPWEWKNAEDYDFEEGEEEGVHSEDPDHESDSNAAEGYYHPANLWEYYICKMVAKDPATRARWLAKRADRRTAEPF